MPILEMFGFPIFRANCRNKTVSLTYGILYPDLDLCMTLTFVWHWHGLELCNDLNLVT